MCQNIFKNDKEKDRKNEFTKLFAMLVQNSVKGGNAVASGNTSVKK